MKIKSLNKKQLKYLAKHSLQKKYEKAVKLFEDDYKHPSLNVEPLIPKSLKMYSFRLDRKYRAVFIIVDGKAEIITITNHYE